MIGGSMIKLIFNFFKMRIHSGLFLTITLFSFASSANQADKVSAIIKKLDSIFAAMASDKKVGIMSLDSMDLHFRTVLKKFPAIQSLMRINSYGVVINEISSNVSCKRMRSVAEQRWFTHTKTTHLPYYGMNRDLAGGSSFFWAWPILSADSQFSGAITVKIYPSELLEMASVDNKSHISILFNGSTIYKRNYLPGISFQSDTVSLSKRTSIVIKLADTDVVNGDSNDNLTAQSSADKSINKNTSSVNSSKPTNNVLSSTNTDASQYSSTPLPVYKTNLINEQPQKKSSFLFMLISVPSIILLTIFIIYIIFNKFIKKPPQHEPSLSNSSPCDQNDVIDKRDNDYTADEIEPIVDVNAKLIDSIQNIFPNDVKFRNEPDNLKIIEVSKAESNENSELFNQTEQTILSEQSNQKSDTEKMLEQKIRKYVYREIHNQIMQWVVCESARLNSRIEELGLRLAQNENGSTEELEEIKHEAEDISKQIDLFRLHLTNTNQ